MANCRTGDHNSHEMVREFEDSILPKKTVWGAHWRSFPGGGQFASNTKDDCILDKKFGSYCSCAECLWCFVDYATWKDFVAYCAHIHSYLEACWPSDTAKVVSGKTLHIRTCAERRTTEEGVDFICPDFSPKPDEVKE